jgi:hypothetical protein
MLSDAAKLVVKPHDPLLYLMLIGNSFCISAFFVSTISTGSSQSLFNLVVLTASMAGSLVAVFGGLLAFLEGKLDLRSVRGAPVAKGDVIRYHSERTDDLEQRAEEQKREILQQKHQNGLQKNEIERLKKTIRLLAQITTPSGDIDLRDQLDRELNLLTALPVDSYYSGTLPDLTADAAQDSHVASPPHCDHHADGVDEDSLRARRWSEDAGWVGCPVGAISADGGNGDAVESAAGVEMAQIAVPISHHSHAQPTGAATYAFAESTLVSHSSHATNVADTMVGITVHAGDCHPALDLPAPPPQQQQQPVKAARANARATASGATKTKTVAKASAVAFSVHVDLDQARGSAQSM